MEAFAERLGVSTDELGKARKVAKLFELKIAYPF